MPTLTLATVLQYLVEKDTDLFLWVNSFHTSFWDVFMPLYSAKYVWIYFYASLLYVIIRNYSLKTTLLWLVAVTLLIFACDQITASVIRPMVARLRPSNLENPLSEVVHVVNGYRGGSYGFFSSHAASTTAVATFFVLLVRSSMLSITLYCWALINMWTRLYLGQHFLTDVIVGMVWGIIAACVAYAICHKLQKNISSGRNFISTQYTDTGYSHIDVDVVVSVFCLTLCCSTIPFAEIYNNIIELIH
jgi:undecaprenyl-diphosphatase